jgi:predicted CoA-binding protein
MVVEFLDKRFIYAIIGASRNPHKYGYKVLKDLIDAGYNAVPVNPNADEILGIKSFKSIENLDNVDVAVFVVPPPIANKMKESILKKNIKKVWFQPGSESPEAIEFFRKNNIAVIYNTCIMIERVRNG